MTEVHYLSMIILSTGTFFFGILSLVIPNRLTRSATYPFVLTLTLCFGAGVLLATSLVHMLTEVQKKLELFTQLYFCSGFLVFYAFDEISHYIWGDKKFENCSSTQNDRLRCERTRNYGAIKGSGSESFICSADRNHGNLRAMKDDVFVKRNDARSHIRTARYSDEGTSQQNSLYQNGIRCHVEIDEPCSSNFVATAGLLIALLIHSVFEGISIGVQSKVSQVIIILGAVTIHKVVISFCLGLELYSKQYSNFNLMMVIFLFSLGSPIGIFIGMYVTSSSGIFNIDAQLQAVAAGSLLYVAAFEVLPRERFKWKHRSDKRAAGIFQLLLLLIGFISITCLHFFLGESADHETTPDDIVNTTTPKQ